MPHNLSQTLLFRHACKKFDTQKKVSKEHLLAILEAGRVAPSSFGMEGWKFLVISQSPLKEKLAPICWGQAQITSSSHLIILLASVEGLKPSSGIPQQRFARRPLPPEAIENYVKKYSTHLEEVFQSDTLTFAWSARQTYIAMTQMMLMASALGIDSCPIEGFEADKLTQALNLDPSQWRPAVLLPIGYRLTQPPKHIRLPFEEVVTFLDEC
jgi:nitroreductase